MKAFIATAAVLVTAVTAVGVSMHVVDDRTMTNCEVSFASNPFNNPKPSSVYTSCGYVYINAHQKNGIGNINAITEMNKAVHSGQPLTIKATGFAGIAVAYEITTTK